MMISFHSLLPLSLSTNAVVFDDEYVRARLITKEGLAKGRAELAVRDPFDAAFLRTVPTSFDARTAWPSCASINDIYDQGKCGDCWAVSAVSSASDRMCIDGAQGNARLSVEHMLGCCKVCGFG